MDKTQEANIRLTMAVKALEGRAFTDDFGIDELKELAEWVVAPTRQSIVPATAIVTSAQ